jgi:thymidylate synthase (FAD)
MRKVCPFTTRLLFDNVGISGMEQMEFDQYMIEAGKDARMTYVSFRIEAPIFVARQLVKHQVGLCWNEESRRYVAYEPKLFAPEKWRAAPENAKQGSGGDLDEAENNNCNIVKVVADGCALEAYSFLKEHAAAEQARMVLPLSSMTNWIWTGHLEAFARVCRQRLDPHAQQETRWFAERIDDLLTAYVGDLWAPLRTWKR